MTLRELVHRTVHHNRSFVDVAVVDVDLDKCKEVIAAYVEKIKEMRQDGKSTLDILKFIGDEGMVP